MSDCIAIAGSDDPIGPASGTLGPWSQEAKLSCIKIASPAISTGFSTGDSISSFTSSMPAASRTIFGFTEPSSKTQSAEAVPNRDSLNNDRVETSPSQLAPALEILTPTVWVTVTSTITTTGTGIPTTLRTSVSPPTVWVTVTNTLNNNSPVTIIPALSPEGAITNPATSPLPSAAPIQSSSNAGPIAGGVSGSMVLVLLLFAFCFGLHWRRKRAAKQAEKGLQTVILEQLKHDGTRRVQRSGTDVIANAR